jgi:pyrimidine operon attenuation protein/uracil phosphoribosyltransferase
MADKNYVLSYEAAQEKLHRMALEIAELMSEDEVPLVLIGIRQSGLIIAEKIASLLEQYIKVQPKAIKVMLDKDLPKEVSLSEEIDFTGKNVIFVDDVSNSGRTLMYALRPLLDFHPKRVLILVLVERMHKQFPIKPDFVGVSVATTVEDYIQVEIQNGEVIGAFVQGVSMIEK